MNIISKNDHFVSSFKQFALQKQLFKTDDRILLAVSGGLDSVVMLQLFCALRNEYGFTLAIAHVHHGLRGFAADRDEAFVRELARNANLPVFSYKADVKKFAQTTNLSIEEAGRILRFRFFEGLLQRLAFHRVSLAHHADDQAETILMHLFRGSGLRGLSGIAPIRGKIVHPLLFASRFDIETWADNHHLTFREDISNKKAVFLRNKIRLNVLPSIKTIYGASVVHRISRAGDAIAETEIYVDHEIQEAIKQGALIQKNHEFILDIPKFLRYFIAIQKGLLMFAIRQIRSNTPFVTFHEIERLLRLIHEGKNQTRIELNDRIEAVRSYDQIIFRSCQPVSISPCQVPLNTWILLPEFGGKIKIGPFSKNTKDVKYDKNPFYEYVDGDLLKGMFRIRTWREGDRFQPLGMKGSKKLHDFFIDLKVPDSVRHTIPILIHQDEIVWIVGYRLSNRFRVKPSTKKIVQLQWK